MVANAPAVVVNAAVVAPDATVTDAGTGSDPLLLESEIPAPPLGAAADRITVQLEVPPAARIAGVQDTELNTAGPISDSDAVWAAPLYAAVITAV